MQHVQALHLDNSKPLQQVQLLIVRMQRPSRICVQLSPRPFARSSQSDSKFDCTSAHEMECDEMMSKKDGNALPGIRNRKRANIVLCQVVLLVKIDRLVQMHVPVFVVRSFESSPFSNERIHS